MIELNEIDIEIFFKDRSNGYDMYDFEGFNVKKIYYFLILLFLKINNVYIYIYNLYLYVINGGIGF